MIPEIDLKEIEAKVIECFRSNAYIELIPLYNASISPIKVHLHCAADGLNNEKITNYVLAEFSVILKEILDYRETATDLFNTQSKYYDSILSLTITGSRYIVNKLIYTIITELKNNLYESI